jgi:hypothetical protein
VLRSIEIIMMLFFVVVVEFDSFVVAISSIIIFSSEAGYRCDNGFQQAMNDE